MLSLGTIGAKAAGNIARLVGQFGSSGPTSGTWNAGDVAPDSRGSFWVCTTGGTPGTWVRIGRSTVFDVRDYGALCDGTTDDTTAVAAAIAAAQAVSTPLIKFQNGSGTFQGGSSTTGAGIVWIPALTLVSNVVGGHRVHITGPGWGAGFYQKASSTGPVYANRRDGSVHAKYTGLQNLAIIGNKANQSAANHGVALYGEPSNVYNSVLDEDYDEAHHVTNCYVYNVKGDGLHMEGSGGNQILGLKIRNADGNGLYSFQDNDISNVDIGWSGLRGVFIDGDDCRLSTVKAWYSGQITAASGQGFYLTSDSGVMTGCSAQDNTAQGLLLDGAFGWDIAGFMADSNSKGSAGTYAQIDVYSSNNNNVTATVRNRYNAGGPGTLALDVAGTTPTQNKITINPGVGVWGVTDLVKSGSTISTNEVNFGASASGWQEIAYAASITPNILNGSDIRIGTLTGNITINNPTYKWEGAKLRLRFKQDATGSRTLTMSSDFDSSTGHGIAINSAANSITTLTFRFSATSTKWELWL
jgi:hypothetical protein